MCQPVTGQNGHLKPQCLADMLLSDVPFNKGRTALNHNGPFALSEGCAESFLTWRKHLWSLLY
jgi:hypothetical protein